MLALSTQGALAVEAAKQADSTSMELGQIPVTAALPFIVQVVGFTVAALYMSVKEDVKGLKEDLRDLKEDLNVKVNDLTAKVNAILLVALCSGVFGYAALKP